MRLFWMRTAEAWPKGSWLATSFTCFDEDRPDEGKGLWDQYIGGVHEVLAGPEGGLWEWSVTATFAGPRCPYMTHGKEPTRKEAGRRVMETYGRMLSFYAANPWRGLHQTED